MENIKSVEISLDNSDNMKSILRAYFEPKINLGNGEYEVCLTSLFTNFKIPNVSEKLKNNTFTYIKDGKPITFTIPTGAYGINHLKDIIEGEIGTGFILIPNFSTFKCEIKTIYPVDFSTYNSIGSLLGFHKRKLEGEMKHISDEEVDIFRVKSVRVHTPIALGKRVNGKNTDIIYDFYIKVLPGYDIIEQPVNLRYYPIKGKNIIDEIVVMIKDQDGNLIDFRNEYIKVDMNIRKIK